MSSSIERIPHIGIVAGTAEGAALCYRTLCLEAEPIMGHRYAHPEITLHSIPLSRYLDAIDRDDWAEVAELMLQSAFKLARVGADFIICPNNTLHKAWSLVKSQIPWLHIAEPVVRRVQEYGWNRVGILGTETVMEGTVYQDKLSRSNIEVVVPKKEDRVRIHQIIRSELVAGLLINETRTFLQGVIADMALSGAKAVILGCTELPLLLSGHQAAVPLLDSTRLLARAALRSTIQVDRILRKNSSVNGRYEGTVFPAVHT